MMTLSALPFWPRGRNLPTSALSAFIATLASVAFAYLTHQSLQTAKIYQANQRAHLTELARQRDVAQAQKADAQLAKQEHAQLTRAGLTTSFTRLQVAESLETLIGKTRHGNLRYTLPAYSENMMESPYRSPLVNIAGTVKDETTFLTLLTQLASADVGGFRPINCNLTPTDSAPTKQIQIDCQLIRPILTPHE